MYEVTLFGYLVSRHHTLDQAREEAEQLARVRGNARGIAVREGTQALTLAEDTTWLHKFAPGNVPDLDDD